MMKCFIFFALVAVAAAFVPVYIPTRDRIQGRYIVVLQDGVNANSVIDRFIRNVTVEANVKTTFEAVLNGFVVEADKDGIALDLLQMLPGVKYIEEDSVVRAAGGQLNPTNSWGQDRIDQRDVQGDSKMILEGYGTETHIYIIDTGINADHPDFSGRAFNVKDVIGGDGLDCNGHGMHMAGIAASETYGIANRAKVYGVRALDCDGLGTMADVISGLEWVANSGIRPLLVSMALAGPNSQAMIDAIAEAHQRSSLVVVAAGNSDDDACNTSPANAPDALTIASSTVDDSRSFFSNWGECVDLFAPGSNIKSLGVDGEPSTFSGTSTACAHAIGAASAIMEHNHSHVGVIDKIKGTASMDKISDPKGTPNRLVYAGL